jgi:hypothetical protein
MPHHEPPISSHAERLTLRFFSAHNRARNYFSCHGIWSRTSVINSHRAPHTTTCVSLRSQTQNYWLEPRCHHQITHGAPHTVLLRAAERGVIAYLESTLHHRITRSAAHCALFRAVPFAWSEREGGTDPRRVPSRRARPASPIQNCTLVNCTVLYSTVAALFITVLAVGSQLNRVFIATHTVRSPRHLISSPPRSLPRPLGDRIPKFAATMFHNFPHFSGGLSRRPTTTAVQDSSTVPRQPLEPASSITQLK